MRSITKILAMMCSVYIIVVCIIAFGVLKKSPDNTIETKLSMMTISDHIQDRSFKELKEPSIEMDGDISIEYPELLEKELIELQETVNQLKEENERLKALLNQKVAPEKEIIQNKEKLLQKAAASTSENPFEMLGAYPDISYIYKTPPNYSKPHLGVINEDDYCTRVDLYNLDHPNNMFKEMNFFTDYPKHTLPRAQVMSKIGKVVMGQISKSMNEKDFNSRKYKLSININNFFNNFMGVFDSYHKIGQHFLCATQMYNHIPGHISLIRKDAILDSFDQYVRQYNNKPQCFNKSTYFPTFYRLSDKKECKAFFKLINSKEYNESLKNEPVQYLIKIGHGSHKGQGVFLLDHNETEFLNTRYNFGSKCGFNKRPLIAQAYITNPLLLDMNNKFDFRLYVLIASTNPLIVYYHDGFLRVSLTPFSKTSEDKATHLTNTYLANQKIEAAKNDGIKLNGMTEKELLEYHLWSFEKLQEYLLQSGKITDPNWLNNYLRPAFYKAIIHIIKMTSAGFLKISNIYELLGLDFILDNDMNLWFIESNPSPLLTGTTKHMIYYEVVKDAFDIQYAYYRGRMKRMVNLIQKMKEETTNNKNMNYENWRQEYQKAAINKLEPEYPIRKDNSFVLIMDENLPEEKAYFGLIPQECVLN